MAVEREKAVPFLVVLQHDHVAVAVPGRVYANAVDHAVVGCQHRRARRPPDVHAQVNGAPAGAVVSFVREIIRSVHRAGLPVAAVAKIRRAVFQHPPDSAGEQPGVFVVPVVPEVGASDAEIEGRYGLSVQVNDPGGVRLQPVFQSVRRLRTTGRREAGGGVARMYPLQLTQQRPGRFGADLQVVVLRLPPRVLRGGSYRYQQSADDKIEKVADVRPFGNLASVTGHYFGHGTQRVGDFHASVGAGDGEFVQGLGPHRVAEVDEAADVAVCSGQQVVTVGVVVGDGDGHRR